MFWQPRKAPDADEMPAKDWHKEPAKWWEIPDEYTDAEINELVLEKIAYEPTAELVDVVPHDVDTGNKFKLSKHAQAEIDGLHKRLALKPNAAAVHARLAELKYSGPTGHANGTSHVAYHKKTNLVVSSGADGRLVLWRLHLAAPMRVPGVTTHGVFTPVDGAPSAGHHALVPLDDETKVFQLPTWLPGDEESSSSSSSSSSVRPTSLAWRDDGKHVLVGTNTNCVWELNVVSGHWTFVFEGRSGAMAACSCHPTTDQVVTVSHDGFLTLWDLAQHACVRRLHLGGGGAAAKAVCVEFHPSGDEIAVGMSNGEVRLTPPSPPLCVCV